MAEMKKTDNTKCSGKDMAKWNYHTLLVGMSVVEITLENWHYLLKLPAHMPQAAPGNLPNINPYICASKDTYKNVHGIGHYGSKLRNQPNVPWQENG